MLKYTACQSRIMFGANSMLSLGYNRNVNMLDHVNLGDINGIDAKEIL